MQLQVSVMRTVAARSLVLDGTFDHGGSQLLDLECYFLDTID
jgi:hypothetical protein